MALETADEIFELASRLPEEEQSRLLRLLQQDRLLGEHKPAITPGHSWMEVRGMAECPMVGEDAQQWVTRTRQEADTAREQQIRHVDDAEGSP